MSPAGGDELIGGESELARALRSAPVLGIERVAEGSNAVFRLALQLPSGEVAPAIYKPARGERPLWDFPRGSLHRREVAAAVVDQVLGWELLPLTVLRRDAPFGVGSVQEYVSPATEGVELDQELLDDQLHGLAAFDVIVNNADRKRAHLLLNQWGHLKAIDHGVTFHTDFKLRTALIELGGSQVPERWLGDLRALRQDRPRWQQLRSKLRALLHPAEVGAFERRLAALLTEGRYPELHQWYGRPFEW